MKKLLKPFVLLGVIALMTIAFSADAGEKSGTIHHAHYFDSDGTYVGSSASSTCDPCGWFRDVFGCNCTPAYGTYTR